MHRKLFIFLSRFVVAFLVTIAWHNDTYAQVWALDLEGVVSSQNDKSKISGAKITIYKNGARIDQVNTDPKGKFIISLPSDAKYLLEFSSPGYTTKRISFNTKNVPPENAEGGNFLFKFDMTLFAEMQGLDVSILSKPLAEVTFDPTILDFNYDKEYTKSVKTQIEQLQADLEAKLAAEAAASKENEVAYAKAIAEGDKAALKSDFGSAKTSYAAALALKPTDPNAKSKLDDSQKKYDKAQAEKNTEKAYTEAIENAEFALFEKDYKKAEAGFQKAFDLKPGDIYARDQLKEIRAIMVNAAKSEQGYITAIGKADAAMAAKDFITAKAEYIKASEAKPTEQYPKDQLAQVESLLVADAKKETDYIKSIERGESSLEAKDYEAAQAAFEQAGKIKPEEKFPKDQLIKIKALLAEITLQNQNYDAAIKRADEAFKKSDFVLARKGYDEALALKPDQQYPKDQIAALVAKQEELKKQEGLYAELIKGADARFVAHDLIAAKAEYVKALEIKPNEAHPKARVAEISGVLEKEAKIEEEYKSALANADNAFKGKDYTSAKFEYQAAAKLKPKETYPTEQLAKVEQFLANAAKKDADYALAVKDGDAKFKTGEFELAKGFYTTAGGLKPEEAYPPAQLKIIEAKLIEFANLNKEYTQLITTGDQQLGQNKLEEAKGTFEKAIALKPTEAYPKDKVAEISKKLAESKQKDEQYNKLLVDGDGAFAKKDLAAAKTAFTAASGLKPEEAYPKSKLTEIEQLQAQVLETQKKYDDAIAKADAAFKENKLDVALPLYKEAAGLKENEKYPIGQITLIEGKLADFKKLDENYKAAISKAELAEKSKDLNGALESYKIASELKPEEVLPKDKIKSITASIAELDKKNAEYNESIALGDEAKKNSEFDIALTAYRKASTVKPEEEYPKKQIAEVEKLKASALAAIELANKQESDYKLFITEADGMFAKKEYAGAKEKYKSALGVKPTEDYPKSKIGEIDLLMAGIAEQKVIDEKYAALIKSGDESFKSKDWTTAKAKYQEAKNTKPAESYPVDQLKAIDVAIAEADALAAQKAKEMATQERDQKYTAAISAGDLAFKSKDWEKAKSSYKEAQSIKTEESYPAAQLKAIDVAIAEAESLASKQAKEQADKALNDKYNAIIAAGDQAFKASTWESARSNYKEALTIKPNETYPAEQLKAIDAAIEQAGLLAEQKNKELAAKELDDKYKAAIAAGDVAFKSQDWNVAREKYNSALGVKPNEKYPADQLAAIDVSIENAKTMASKQAKEQAEKELNEKYTAAITQGDKAFKSKDWETAKTKYNEAKSLKAEEAYPKDQLAAIVAAIAIEAELASKNSKEAELKAMNDKYNGLIAKGDQDFKTKKWEAAKSSYQSALEVKANESYPKEQIALIDAEIANAGKEAKRGEYDAYISSADLAFKSKDWASARTNYNSATALFPNENYPKDQLARIDEAESKAGAIALQNQQDEKYRQAIGDADQLFNNLDYTASKSKYEAALGIKPTESYPKTRIAEINGLIAARDNDAAKKEEQYNQLIAKGDEGFNTKNYKAAKTSYAAALNIKNDPYPKSRMDEIDQLIAAAQADAQKSKQNDEAQLLEKYNKFIALGDADFSSNKYENAKSNYQAALSVKPNESYPQDKLREIDNLLKKQQMAAQSAPTKKSSGMSDAEIAGMMAKWQSERDQAKVDKLNQTQKDFKESTEEQNKSSLEKRTKANDDLDQLELTLAESNKAGENKNLEEAKVIDEIKAEQEDFHTDMNKQASQKHEEKYATLEKDEEGQREMKEKGNELYVINTEKNNTEKIEYAQTQDERIKNGNIRTKVNSDDLVDLEKNIHDDVVSKNNMHMRDVERIQNDNALVASTITTWNDESREKRSDSYDDIRKLEKSINEFQAENNESYKNNTDQYWKNTDELAEYQSEKNKESKNKRNKTYGEIVDYQESASQITEEKHNKYLENSEKIKQENSAVLDYQTELSANADERRMKHDNNYYQGEKKPRYPEIAREHSQGVTEESFEEGDSFVIKRTVVVGESINEYKKIFYKWGGVYYKKNEQNTTEVIWNTETQ